MSPQSQLLYQALLRSKNPLSAKKLSTMLHIFPNTVYRLAEPLINMGLITKMNQYPYEFVAKPLDEGLSMYLLHQNDWFSQSFSQRHRSPSGNIQFSFIQSREELFNVSIDETNKASQSVDLLRSGQEIPAELMLAIIEAKKRNVVTRMLIQDYAPKNINLVNNWKKNGILVRHTTLRHMRLMLYDSTSVYFMSYRHSDSERDLGMKISYAPFATILSQLFDDWWRKADKV